MGPVDAGKSMPSPSPGGGFLLLAKRERTMNRRVAAVLRGTVGITRCFPYSQIATPCNTKTADRMGAPG